jgi:uncharacterized lipoprotein YmbA
MRPFIQIRRGMGSLAVALLLLTLGCASTPPSSFYTLAPIAQARSGSGGIAGGGLAVGLGPVVFPQFLDRPQLVLRDGANQLNVDEFHRWGGTVQDDFLRVWGENTAYLLGTSRLALFPSESRMPLDFRVLAEVLAFEGSIGGDAVLRVRWSVMDERLRWTYVAREDAYHCPIDVTATNTSEQAQAAARNAAVVAAMSRCLGDFSGDVAAVLRSLPKPQPEPQTQPRTQPQELPQAPPPPPAR